MIRSLFLMTVCASVIAALAASNFSRIQSLFHADRGYPNLDIDAFLNSEFRAAKIDRTTRIRQLSLGIETVDSMMQRFAEHDFLAAENMGPVSGWLMTTETGDRFHRATLQRQSRIFESLGESAVPSLVKWLNHEQIEVRYIASNALELITGLNPEYPYFATLEDLRENGWLTNSQTEYTIWYNEKIATLDSPDNNMMNLSGEASGFEMDR